MKILQVVPALEQGGVELDAVELAIELAKRGIANGIVSAGGGLVERLEQIGVPHHELPLVSKNPFRILANAKSLKKLVRAEGYDLVHVRSRAPAWSVKLACSKIGVKWLATYHGVYGTEPKWLKLPYNRVMLGGERTICVSQFVQRHVESVYHPREGQLLTIHDGADTDRFRPDAVTPSEIADFRKELGFLADIPIVVMVGRLTRWKGQHILLNAIAAMRHSEVGVLFVGSDQGRVEYSRELKELADKLPKGKKAVFIDRYANMPLVYASGAVAVNASSGQPEAFGRVIPEAQAMGTIVVGTAHGGACETIDDGKTGFLVPPGDVTAMANRLDEILDMDESARETIRKAAIDSVNRRYSIAVTCERTLRLYREILSNSRM